MRMASRMKTEAQKRANREAQRRYRQTAKGKEHQKRYRQSAKGKEYDKRYRQSADDFRDYVINELKVDPRGLQIHRIDNDGHYERGNIVFVTREEHKEIHMKL